ncbi:act minimal PKS acyl carrier protein [Streptacidiphilus sp. MAP12-33]|uniref:acyl carrier protein n=1 Tax=Streptacidiphilus sp. MAP12-33 TaxID=3156266 RepID=UPI0035120D09
MAALTIDGLKDILRISAGEDESDQLTGDIAETSFSELGYDSLALLETAALIKREYGVDITDNLENLGTPQSLTDWVNAQLTAA